MTHETTRNKPSQPKQRQPRQQQGGQGGGSQYQQQNPQSPGQPGGDPDVHEKLPDRDVERERGDPRKPIDVERE